MISKKYRLNEREFRKVLSKRKPFFSYNLVANVSQNALGYCRCGIILSSKQAPGSVNRNHFRRLVYDLSHSYLGAQSYDVVFVTKKGYHLDAKNPALVKAFGEEIGFLWKTIQKNNLR